MDDATEIPMGSPPTIQDYCQAFLEAKSEKKLSQKDMAEKWGIREADLSGVLRYILGKSDEVPTPFVLNKVTKCFQRHCIIQNGQLCFIDSPSNTEENPVKVHKDYREANIGAAVMEAGAEVCLINTYLTAAIVDTQLGADTPGTLKNWLSVQNKKVKILVLKPDGKGMLLRSQTDLGSNGAALAETILHQLNYLLELQKEYMGRLEIRLMDEIPGAAGILLTNRLFFGLHLATGHTELSAWYEITDPNHVSYKNFKDHFDLLWEERSIELTLAHVNHFKKALNIVRLELDFLTNSFWKVRLHNMTDVIQGKHAAPFADTIGKLADWELEITRPERSIYLMAKLTIPGLKKTSEVKLVTEKLDDRDYAHARFSDFEQVSIHLSFHCRVEDRDNPFLLGYFIISAGGDCCSGYIVLQKVNGSGEPAPEIHPYLTRLLTFRDSSYFSLQRTRTDMNRFKSLPYAGIYKVYSYGGNKGGQKFIKLNWLQIDEFGVARYRNKKFASLTGRATIIDHNLHIVFTHIKDGQQLRRSYLIISVPDEPKETGTFYSAVHLGVSEDPSMPVGKRFILEHQHESDFDLLQPDTVALHSEKYNLMEHSLRGLLSGRLKNLLGFLRREGKIKDLIDIKNEWKDSIKMSEVFFDSAVWNAQQGLHGKSAEMILRAVNHGFNQLERFEETIKKIKPEMLLLIQRTQEYAVVQDLIGTTNGGNRIEYHD